MPNNSDNTVYLEVKRFNEKAGLIDSYSGSHAEKVFFSSLSAQYFPKGEYKEIRDNVRYYPYVNKESSQKGDFGLYSKMNAAGGVMNVAPCRNKRCYSHLYIDDQIRVKYEFKRDFISDWKKIEERIKSYLLSIEVKEKRDANNDG